MPDRKVTNDHVPGWLREKIEEENRRYREEKREWKAKQDEITLKEIFKKFLHIYFFLLGSPIQSRVRYSS
jgi:hypothetical protein